MHDLGFLMVDFHMDALTPLLERINHLLELLFFGF